MDVSRRWSSMILMVLMLSVCCIDVVNSKKDKESPVMAPAEAPTAPTWESPTWNEREPTEPVKTPSPTRHPTTHPSTLPSLTPSSAPSVFPSTVPSFLPSKSPPAPVSPEPDDTLAPLSPAPTDPPMPASAPVDPTTGPTGPIVQVRMPDMELTLRILGRGVDSETISASLGTFVQEAVVSSASTFPGFASAVIDVDVETFSTSRRQLQSGRTIVMADAKGDVYFDNKQPPTEGDLESVLITYFSYYGDDDLEVKLKEENGYVVDNMEIVIGGKVVDDVDGGGFGMEQPGNPDGLTAEGRKRERATPGLVAGLVIGCVALFISIILLVWQRRRDKLNDAEQMAADTSLMVVGGGDTSLDAAPLVEAASSGPGTPSRLNISGLADDDQLSFGGISLEDSIYTTNTMEQHNPPSLLDNTMEASYDAKRLDKVISDAHNYVRSQAEDRASLTTDPTFTSSDST